MAWGLPIAEDSTGNDLLPLKPSPPHVGWVTNFEAPYRRPVWRALAASTELTVILLDGAASADVGANRGHDWDHTAQAEEPYETAVLRTLRVRRGESRYYLGLRVPRIKGLDAVVLGGWESPVYWQILIRARRSSVPVIGFYESHAGSSEFQRGAIAAVRSRWFRSLDAVVVPGEASRSALLDIGVEENRVFVGFNAVDVHAIASDAAAHRTTGPGHRFLYVGQMIERKNVAALIEAFAEVREPADTLTIVGQGDQESRLRELSVRLGLEERVRFAGYVPQAELGEVLGGADTLVLPSTVEVWGLVVNEALASGLHVVVSHHAGVARSVEDMAGVWVSGTEVPELADAMRASRDAYSGPIPVPQLLDYTPERFASTFLSAVESVRWPPLQRR